MPISTTSPGGSARCGDLFSEADAFDVLHHDEDLAAVFAYFVDGADVGMVQGGRRLRLVNQPLPGLRIRGPLVGQHLIATLRSSCVFGEKHFAHAAGSSELPHDSVMGDF